MKSNIHILLTSCLLCVAGTTTSRAAGEGACELAVASLKLPDEASGLLHWRAADEATQPLQLSTRYFSERIKPSGKVIHFYNNPVQGGTGVEPPPPPLIAVTLPADTRLVYVILWTESDTRGETHWKSILLRGEEWKPGCLKVLNGSTDTIGIAAGEKRLQVPRGKALDFHAREFREPFPVKIFRLKPETKMLFSSKWRIAANRRELCFIGGTGDAISLRSLLDLAEQQPSATR